MSSPAINRLVSFITRPLMSLHTAATMVSLQIYLHAALSAIPTPSSLLLSAHSLPPPQIQTACIAAGIQWADWLHLLSNGKDVELFISASALAVQISDGPRMVLWTAPAVDACATIPLLNAKSPALKPAGTAFAVSLRTTLASARARRAALISPSDSESDSSDSESDSDVSDSGSSFTSNSSTTSVSSLDSDVPCAPIVDRAKVDVTRYMYHGGVTQVMSGGVMLGGAPRPTPKASAPRPTQTAHMLASRLKTSRSAVSANNWRKTV
ncbi:hypothetical protein C8J57DRAFT_1300719 [Mycena rebaudengoi]|nr:hypothetical protein C8J57DRAFT_1300719 [Mycena rebaudengoi]